MKKLKGFIHNGKHRNDLDLKPFVVREVSNDLHIVDGLVCRGRQLVIPPSLQKRVIQLSHAGHQGICKAKNLIRTFCWFLGIDRMVESKVASCIPCQTVQPPCHKEPIKPSELPWQYLEMDFQGPYPGGEYMFVVIDRYSRWPEVTVFNKAPNAKTTINALKSVFSRCSIYLSIRQWTSFPVRGSCQVC